MATVTPSSGNESSCDLASLPTATPGTLTWATTDTRQEPWFVGDDPAVGRGFEAAVAEAVTAELGWREADTTWLVESRSELLLPGPKDFDIAVAQIRLAPNREDAVDYSAPYHDLREAVVVMSGSQVPTIRSTADLRTLRLGIADRPSSREALAELSTRSEPTVFDNDEEAVVALRDGRVDALVVPLTTALYLGVVELQGSVVLGTLPVPTKDAARFALALEKGSPLTACVSRAVESLRRDGTLARLEEEWLPPVLGL